GSISTAASRTSTPVIRLISCRSASEALLNSCRWNSCTWAAPAGLLARALSAGDRAPCSVITSVSSPTTTPTDRGTWPVRTCSKARAACPISCAMVKAALFIDTSLVIAAGPRHPKQKKADVAGHLQVPRHVGLLVNEPPGLAGLPFI